MVHIKGMQSPLKYLYFWFKIPFIFICDFNADYSAV